MNNLRDLGPCFLRMDDGFLFMNNGSIHSQKFVTVREFIEGFAAVEVKDLGWNFVDSNGNLISKSYFKCVRNFHEGFAAVCIDDLWNFIDTAGNLLLHDNFKEVLNFHNGRARVERVDGFYNYVDFTGKFLYLAWREGAWNYKIIQNSLDNKYNFMTSDGRIISDKWFESVHKFDKEFELASVCIADNIWNIINTNGEFICDQHFDFIKGSFNKVEDDGLIDVYYKRKGWNFVNHKGELISDNYFEHTSFFENGLCRVERKDEKYNYINKKGELISKKWFKDASLTFCDNGLAYVIPSFSKKEYYLRKDGTLFSKES